MNLSLIRLRIYFSFNVTIHIALEQKPDEWNKTKYTNILYKFFLYTELYRNRKKLNWKNISQWFSMIVIRML